jgi:hypothetical protein
MKSGFFGDSYDIVKRSLIAWLEPLGQWAVHPMFTETPSPEFVAGFSALVGAPLVSSAVLDRSTDRSAYFASCSTYSHLLLDPNTGLRFRLNAKESSPNHLFDSDLVSVVNQRPGALTVVFDQALTRVRGRDVQLELKLEKVRAMGLCGFAYNSHACFLFVAREAETTQRARDLLCGEGHLPGHRLIP